MSLGAQKAVRSGPIYRKGDDVAALFARARTYHQLGHLAEAEVGYRKILKKRPNHVEALYMLAVCSHQIGDSLSAERLLRRAFLLDPQSAPVHCALGILLAALQRKDEALACFDKLIAMKADFIDAHFQQGNVLLGLGRFPEAIVSFDNAMGLDPHHVNALTYKGHALHELGRFAEAITCYNRILAVNPAHVPSLINRGAAFKDSRQVEKAIAEFDLALAIDPDHGAAWLNRGEALLVLNRLDQALASYDKALSIDSELVQAWLGRANILMLTKNVTESLAACHRALGIEPNCAKALTQLGLAHSLQGDTEIALAYFDRALTIKPDLEYALSGRIFIEDFKDDADFALHQASRSGWWHQIGSKISTNSPPQHKNDRDPTRRIVLGYVSAEFRQRSAAYTYRPVLENHDRARYEVVCYSGTPTEDAVTESFRRVADRWRTVLQWSDDRLVECIQADKIDILIDLSGHAEGNRLRTFARKPAPIQVSAWGHANGTGLPTIDYLFSDPVMVPSEVRHLFAEQVYDLPCAIIVEPPRTELRSAEPPVVSNGYATYGVFNRISKISVAAIGLWARILRSDITSRLLIKDYQLDDAGIRGMLLEKFASHGIATDRICLMGSTSREEHLATYRQVDICLDPFPHGGGVSTWESLHMGVPVVAKLGNGATSRVGGAILSATGMTDWVATNDDQYVEIALRSSPVHLKTIRHELPNLIGQRCNPVTYTRAVEEAYRTMWEKHCGENRGLNVQPLDSRTCDRAHD
jgi:predicted O-linked N-acetylglucosamine transferase (SPINDLY family)